MLKRTVIAIVLATALMVEQGPVRAADDRESIEELRNTVINLLDALVQKGVMTKEQAQAMVSGAQAKAEAAAKARTDQEASEQDAIRVPYVPQIVKDEISKEVAQNVTPQVIQGVVAEAKSEGWGVPGAMPDWLSRVRMLGDLRLRFQGDYYAPDNYPNYWLDFNTINTDGGIGKAGENAFLNVSNDLNRLQVRARIGLEATLTPTLTAGVRLSTGNPTTPGSETFTMGTGFDRYPVQFDLIYLKNEWRDESEFPWLTLEGGRIPRPFFTPTNLVYYQDMTFEGVAATSALAFGEAGANRSHAFATIGAFPLSNDSLAPKDNKWMLGGQLGLVLGTPGRPVLTASAAYYDFLHVTGEKNSPNSTVLNYTAPAFIQFGNTVFDISNNTTDPTVNLFGLAAHFRLLNAGFRYEYPVQRYVLGLNADYVHNVGYSAADVLQISGISQAARTMGNQEELFFGDPLLAEKGHWRAVMGYRYLQRDAVIDAWTDADFHEGGTNARGFYLTLDYGLTRGTYMQLKYLGANVIDGPTYIDDIVQLDVNSQF
jgi:polyhydroxyalkanoate synthesis regulator phasin